MRVTLSLALLAISIALAAWVAPSDVPRGKFTNRATPIAARR